MNRYDPDKHHRRSIRLRGYDYTQTSAYFVTICTWQRECTLGYIENGRMIRSEWGRIVDEWWHWLPDHSVNLELDAFVVMPNHVHGIIVIRGERGIVHIRRGTACRAPTTERFGRPVAGSLPTIIRSFKSAVTQRINTTRNTAGLPVWQRNYYEHIIRNEDEWNEIRAYISENLLKWELDKNHPNRLLASKQNL